MRVKINNDVDILREVGKIEIGDSFMFNNKPHILVDVENEDIQLVVAFNIQDRKLVKFGMKQMVAPVFSELIISYDQKGE